MKAARVELDSLEQELTKLLNEISAADLAIQLQNKRNHHTIVILGMRVGISVEWRSRYANTLDKSRLIVGTWNGHPPFLGVRYIDEPAQLSSEDFEFDITTSGTYCSRDKTSTAREYQTGEIADHILKRLMDEEEE